MKKKLDYLYLNRKENGISRSPSLLLFSTGGLRKPTYLLPEDYDYLMSTLQSLIASGELIKPRTCLGPENYGFNVYSTNINEMYKGPDVIGQVKFISGTSWLFKFRTRKKYKL